MVHYYIYYRVDTSSLLSITAAVAALFESIERSTGVRGRWMRRRDDPSTYMEVYEGIVEPAAFDAALSRLAAEVTALVPDRHLERFSDASIERAADL